MELVARIFEPLNTKPRVDPVVMLVLLNVATLFETFTPVPAATWLFQLSNVTPVEVLEVSGGLKLFTVIVPV
jgi:hypothetical protein